MRELIGHLVASRGAGDAAARKIAGIPERLLCKQYLWKQFPCKQDRVRIGDDSISVRFAIGNASSTAHARTGRVPTDDILTDCVRTSIPITVIYVRENLADHAVAEIAGKISDLDVFDCGSQAGHAAGAVARRG